MKYKNSTKISLFEIFYFGSSLLFMLLIFVQVIATKNSKTISAPINATIIEENDDISIINLYVVEKRIKFQGLTGILNKYYLVLSNDMSVYVSKKDFNKYEIGQYYDFELVERTTVSQWVRQYSDP